MAKIPKERDKYIIKVGKELVQVSKEIYIEYYKMKNRERYLERTDKKHGLVHLNKYDNEISNGEDMLHDHTADVEKIVMTGILIDELLECLSELNENELALIYEIYFDDKPIRQIAREKNVSDTAIRKKRDLILQKLKSMIKN